MQKTQINPNRRDAEVPGIVQECTEEYRTPLATRAGEVQVHNKAVRMLAGKYSGMHANLFNSLAIVSTYLGLHKRQRQSIEHILDWSGANIQWKRKVERGIKDLVNMGFLLIEGKSVWLSEEGRRVLDDYNKTWEDAKGIYINKAQKALLKRKQATESRKR